MHILKYILLLLSTIATAQVEFTVKGHFNATENKEITLSGYTAGEDLLLNKTTTDNNGNFTISYPANYVGAALLQITKGKKVIVLLNHENFEMQWGDLSSTKTLKFINSTENATFDAGLSLYQNTQEKKTGIAYLVPFYNDDAQKSLFFKTELSELNAVIPNYLNKLSDKTYAAYYLKIRVLIADLHLSIKRYPENKPELEKQFNSINFSDARLLHSGLQDELIDAYILANENATKQLQQSINIILKSLKSKPEVKQNIAEYMFTTFEKRSLFECSEYIALAMLTDDSCQLDDKHKALFEQYRKMANGNKAPDITFFNAQKSHLYDLKSQYQLVVFGASWCFKCVEEIPKLKKFYENWKTKHNLEIVFISLDTQKAEYEKFIKDFPWLSSCDYKEWETKAAKDYCVFGTPTMYLLDANHTIKLKPISAEQVNSWLLIH